MLDSPEQIRLTRYLLGLLPDEESERLDELSVTNEEFAAELNVAENDLVDAYARGELPSEFVGRFKDVYSSSPRRRKKLRLAETFLSYLQKTRTAIDLPPVAQGADEKKRWFAWFVPQWGFAAAAAALLLVSGYLGLVNHGLRQHLNESELARNQVEKQQELRQTSASDVGAANPASPISTDHLHVAAFVLLPSLRGPGPLPRVTVPLGTDLVVLKLELEPSEFPMYRVMLEDAATRNVIWTSGNLKPLHEEDQQTVSFGLKPSVLESKNYILELKGVRQNGQTELVSTYPFKSSVK
jgi:hypothetical protein